MQEYQIDSDRREECGSPISSERSIQCLRIDFRMTSRVVWSLPGTYGANIVVPTPGLGKPARLGTPRLQYRHDSSALSRMIFCCRQISAIHPALFCRAGNPTLHPQVLLI